MSVPQTITTSTEEAFYTIRVTLDGVIFGLEFAYSTREDCYYLDILDAVDAPIIRGIKLVPNIPLLTYARAKHVPAGELVVQSLSGAKHTPRWGELAPDGLFELTYYAVGDG